MLTRVDGDIELEFVREFSVGGRLQGLSADDRREHIRVSIYAQQLMHRPFRDSGISYLQAYEKCYGQLLEMRRAPRPILKVMKDDEL
jgi:hypothetical protein